MERELVVRAQGGDADAFSTLARRAVDRLYAVAFRILRDPDRADDATQQALISAWDHIGALRDPDCFEAWTYRMVVRAALKEARREWRQHRPAHSAELRIDDNGDVLEAVVERDELDHAFRTLSPEHRAVVVLHYYADLPLAQIAEIVGIPVGTVGSRLFNGVRRLRAALDREALVVAERSMM